MGSWRRREGEGEGRESVAGTHAISQLPTLLLYFLLFLFFISHFLYPPFFPFSSYPIHLHHTHCISLQWTVASSALKILLKLVDQHELSSEDLIEQNYEILQGAAGGGVVGGVGGGHATQFIKLPKPPGFNILLHLLNDTPLLRKVRMHIDCTQDIMESFNQFRHIISAIYCHQIFQNHFQRCIIMLQ